MEFFLWWQRTDCAAKAILTGMSILAPGITCPFLSGMASLDDVIRAECSSVTTGSIEDAEIYLAC